jgi:outer membrane protein OmpA-like peptidoglycan-associated protein
MRRGLVIGLICLLLLIAFATFAQAQDAGFDAQLFRPSIFGGRFHTIEGAQTHWPLCYGFGLYFNYANSPMELRVGDEFSKGVLNSVLTANITGAFMPLTWFALGIDMPVHLMARGYQFEDPTIGLQTSEGLTNTVTPGDLKAELKFTALNIDQYRVGLAIAPFAHFPTGDPTMFLGEGTVLFGGKILLEVDAVIFNVAVNGGYAYREQRDIFGVPMGSAFLYGAGIGRDFNNGLGFSVEAFGSYMDSGSVNVAEGSTAPQELSGYPIEALAFLRYTLPNKVRFMAGGGGAISPGIGAPSYRIVGGVDYHPDCIPPTTGLLIIDVVNEQDLPVKSLLIVKKHKTGTFKTGDDGHFEREAAAGDYTIAAAAKGYDPNSAKGTVIAGKTTNIRIVLIKPPEPTELTIKVVHKKSGKPILGAGILIKNVETGKFSGMKAPSGVWEDEYTPGKFKFTGVAKGYERVDVVAEVIKSQKNKVTIKLRRKIIKIGKVQFAYDSADLLPAAFPVLDDVLKKINEADFTFKTVVIEGHTSSEGSDEYNMKLSERRAKSVKKYLIKKGLAADLLQVQAFGETKPITTNETDAGKEKNRRVEFIFEE